MTRSVLLAAATATLGVALTACGGEGASEAGPSASSTVSVTAPATVTTVETEPGTSSPEATAPAEIPATKTTLVPTAPTDPPAQANPCADVTREYLITTLRMTGTPKYPLADLQNARCSGNYASATSQPEGTLHPVMYLFKYSEVNGNTHWRVIDVGEGLDCVNRHGVPAAAGRAIGCAA
ncbi:hypothetical protein AB0H76_12755 [Nocardia sp. NPDC050712]|uniref:hypothetical protein n=1 Tax=Nocardia sp. NPDC050712 TaxID=3155518 RepID=UPI0033C9A272